jgi:hypothetical protein
MVAQIWIMKNHIFLYAKDLNLNTRGLNVHLMHSSGAGQEPDTFPGLTRIPSWVMQDDHWTISRLCPQAWEKPSIQSQFATFAFMGERFPLAQGLFGAGPFTP